MPEMARRLSVVQTQMARSRSAKRARAGFLLPGHSVRATMRCFWPWGAVLVLQYHVPSWDMPMSVCPATFPNDHGWLCFALLLLNQCRPWRITTSALIQGVTLLGLSSCLALVATLGWPLGELSCNTDASQRPSTTPYDLQSPWSTV